MLERRIATAISITSLGVVLAGTVAFADAKVGTVTASALNIRSGPSTSYSKVTKAYKGDKVEILETSNGWYKIKLSNGKIGWGSGEYITTSNTGSTTPSTGKNGTVTASALNVRSGPSTSNGVVGKAYKGNSVEILESSNGWHKIKLSNGTIGWASGQYISTSGSSNNGGNENTQTPSTGKNGTVTASALNVRSGPSTSNKVVGKAYKGNSVEILESSNGWHKIKLSNGTIGWASGQYISTSGSSSNGGNENNQTPSTGKKGTVTASALNIRSGPSTSNRVVGKAYKGNSVEILESSNGWHKIKLSNGTIGWASGQYINTSGSSNNGGNTSGDTNGESETSNKAQSIINTAKAQIGKPYVWGAEGPNAFDCSGLVYYVYGQNGIRLPRTSREQSNVGTTISKSNLQPGDLIFSSTDGSGGVSHVGIYIGNGEMIHAPNSKSKVKVTSINSSYWQKAFVRAKRVI